MAGAEDRKERPGVLPEQLAREDVLKILEAHDRAAREALARRTDAAPEVLFLLATEGNEAARRAVAANPSTPAHANRLLADDKDDEVRIELAQKIGRIMPDLSQEESKRLRELTIETLERLASDQLVRVRQVLAEEIKSMDCIPKRVIKKLARDVESVAAPILEYSPLLSDADLIELLTTAQARYALVAVARRRPLNPSVSEVVAAALDVPAVATLLANSTAQIRRQTLDKIAEHAAKITDWHLPLVLRSDLSQRAIRRIAGFVSSSLIAKLASRAGLDDKMRQELKQRMRERLDEEGFDPEVSSSRSGDVKALFKAGRLDDNFVESAAEGGRRETLVTAFSLLANVPEEVVRKIFQAGSAKPVTALVWRAKLSMRVAFKIQTFVMHLTAGELLPARAGVHFPMTEDEMRWHLNYFGVRS